MESCSLDEAACALRRGEVAIFPTDTVYGLGVAVNAADGPGALYALKGRDEGKPIAWLVDGPAALDRYGCDVLVIARLAAAAFWPGPLTLIVRASDAVPPAFRSAAVVWEGGGEDAFGIARGAGAESAPSGCASTVLDCTTAPPRILREGAIPLSAIEALLAEPNGEGRG